jgi:hypothetical protein
MNTVQYPPARANKGFGERGLKSTFAEIEYLGEINFINKGLCDYTGKYCPNVPIIRVEVVKRK